MRNDGFPVLFQFLKNSIASYYDSKAPFFANDYPIVLMDEDEFIENSVENCLEGSR